MDKIVNRKSEIRKKKSEKIIFCFLFFVFYLLSSVLCFAEVSREEEALFIAKKAFEDGFYEASSTLFNRFLDKFPQSALSDEANLYLGRCYFYQKKYNDAIGHFNALLRSLSAGEIRGGVYYWIAEAYFRTNDFPQAYDFYEKLLRECPESPYSQQAIYSSAWCLFEQGKFEQAKERFSQFKNKFPRDALSQEADFKIVECLYNLKDYAKLKTELERIDPSISLSVDKESLSPVEENSRKEKAGLLKFYLAESCFYLEDYVCAIDNYSKALASSRDVNLRELIYLGLGWSHLKSNDYVKAGFNFDKVLQDETKEENGQGAHPAVVLEAYLGKADVLYQLSNYSEAISAYKEASRYLGNETSPSTTLGVDEASLNRLNYGLGLSYLKAGNFNEALNEFSSLTNRTKDAKIRVAEEANFYLGRAYYESGDFLNGYLQLRKFVSIYPSSALKDEGLILEALSLKSLKRFQEAYVIFKSLLNNKQAPGVLARAEFEMSDCLYQSGRIDEALERWELLRSKYPESEISSLVLLRLAGHYYQENKPDLCRRYLLGLINAKPQAGFLNDSYYLLGLCFEKEGRCQEAMEAFKKVEGMAAEIYPRIADCLKALGKFQDAISYYRMCLKEKAANTPEIQFKLAECLEESGAQAEAVEEYSRLSGNETLVVKGLLRCGKLLENQGKWQSAIKVYEKISGLDVQASKFARERVETIKEEYLEIR